MRNAYRLPLVIIAVVAIFFSNLSLTSCTKKETVTVQDTVTVAAKPTTVSLLAGTYWEMDSAISNYTKPGTGTLVYVRGGSGNTLNLDNNFYTWTSNGVEVAVENGTYYQFQWNFVNDDSSLLKIYSNTITDYARIISISSTRYVEYDSTGSFYDVLIPAP